jgi:hypothetical protein
VDLDKLFVKKNPKRIEISDNECWNTNECPNCFTCIDNRRCAECLDFSVNVDRHRNVRFCTSCEGIKGKKPRNASDLIGPLLPIDTELPPISIPLSVGFFNDALKHRETKNEPDRDR